ncbi:MAG: hypothetical protein N2439_12420 [Anaerolineae bacterium]|nr:hypothetical protein [Anaerolineae bacterium]
MPLATGRAFLSWVSRQEGNDDIYYAVLDSNGDLIRPATDLSVDESVVDWRNFDVVQFADGRILAVWEAWGCFPGEWVGRIRLALLDVAYNRIGTPHCLLGIAPGATSGDTAVSITADAAGRAVLTWTDASWEVRRNLYYAFMQSNGVVLTPPMIFRSGGIRPAGGQYIATSFEGYGNTSYNWVPPAGVDGVATFSAPLFSGSPGGGAAVSVRAANYGARKAMHALLTVTLADGLAYLSDTSGIAPVISGNQVSWRLPDMGLFDEHSFIAYIGVPAGAIYDTRYPITLTLTSDGPEANPMDNTATAQVMAARQIFLPLLLRGY